METGLIVLCVLAVLIVLGIIAATNLSSRPYYEDLSKKDGMAGEHYIASILQSCCHTQNEPVMNNVILFDTQTGRSSQIDHILICNRGIFIVETKDYSGLVFGNDQQRQWTQVLIQGRRKRKIRFHSPVKQNATHCYLVKRILHQRFPIYGVVVFVQNNIQRVQSSCICSSMNLSAYIHSHGVESALNEASMEEARQLLQQHIDSYRVSASEHMSHIAKLENDLKNNICPRCGGNLVLRKGSYGCFYGCSNYPKCKFTKKIDR